MQEGAAGSVELVHSSCDQQLQLRDCALRDHTGYRLIQATGHSHSHRPQATVCHRPQAVHSILRASRRCYLVQF
jgi:hypothetical protein